MLDSYDYAKLIGKMREKNFTQAKLAKGVGISETSVNLSLNNKRDFKQNEIISISNLLEIPLSDVETYFFAKRL